LSKLPFTQLSMSWLNEMLLQCLFGMHDLHLDGHV
jgi:hypothetical protein